MVLSVAAGASGETDDDFVRALRGFVEKLRSDRDIMPEELERWPRTSRIAESVFAPCNASADLIGKIRAFRSIWTTENLESARACIQSPVPRYAGGLGLAESDPRKHCRSFASGPSPFVNNAG